MILMCGAPRSRASEVSFVMKFFCCGACVACCALLSGVLWLGGAGTALEPEGGLVVTSAMLVPQSGEGSQIRSLFNENVDRVRLMVLLSPT
jgi:hypothetical protein